MQTIIRFSLPLSIFSENYDLDPSSYLSDLKMAAWRYFHLPPEKQIWKIKDQDDTLVNNFKIAIIYETIKYNFSFFLFFFCDIFYYIFQKKRICDGVPLSSYNIVSKNILFVENSDYHIDEELILKEFEKENT